MKLTNIKTTKSNKGMTLIELTVVILVLLSLISVLFIGARAWMRGSDRANAAILIRNAQIGVRSQTNILGIETPAIGEGDLTWADVAPAGIGTLQFNIFGSGKFVENGADAAADPANPTAAETAAASDPPAHPASGNDFVAGTTSFETIPEFGSLYMTSSEDAAFFAPSGIQ